MSIYIRLSAARTIFTLEKKLAMLNMSNAQRKKRRCIGASCSARLSYLHPSKLIYDRYTNKEKLDALGGIIINLRYVIRVTRREQLCIVMKHENFGDHELHCIQKWVRVIREDIETHLFKDSEEKEEGGEVEV